MRFKFYGKSVMYQSQAVVDNLRLSSLGLKLMHSARANPRYCETIRKWFELAKREAHRRGDKNLERDLQKQEEGILQ